MPLISQRQFARDNDVSPEAISQAVKTKRLPSVGGKIDPAKAQPIWNRIADPARAGRKLPRTKPAGHKRVPRQSGKSFDDAKTKREYLRVEREELELAQLRSEVVDAGEMRRQLDGFIYNTRAKLLSLGHRLAAQVAIESDKAKCRELIDGAVSEYLQELAAFQGKP
jgi:hypothetical protein